MTDLEYIIMFIGFGLWFWAGYSVAKNRYYKKVEYPKYIDFDIIKPTIEELNDPDWYENNCGKYLRDIKIDCSENELALMKPNYGGKVLWLGSDGRLYEGDESTNMEL